jgi:tetratricopeptide (TPR) repeat protein
VQNVVADRIDRLPIAQKHLLQTAAVIGVVVPFRLLRSVAELPDDELYEYLANLQSAEFIYETNLFPEVEYSFKHALTNDVAYGALLHDRRTWLHARTVSALETIAGGNLNDYVETLAHHAFEGELWEKAVVFLRQAGTKATKRFANMETVAFLKRALESLGKLNKNRQNVEQAIDIRLDLRNALFLIGEFEPLYNYLREAESLAETLGDQRRLGRVLNFLVSYFGLTGKHDQAIIHGRRALSSNKDCAELNSVSYYYLGQAHHHKGDYYQSIDMLKRTLSLVSEGPDKYEHFGTPSIISVICRVWLVQSFAEVGSFRDGISYARDAIHIAEEAGQAYCLAYAFCSLGFLLLVKGDFEEAVPVLEKAQRICDESEIKVLLTHVGAHLGYTYAFLERSEEGLRLLENSDEQSDLIGRKAGQSLRVTWHGQARFLAGQVEEARKYATRALALATQTKERGYEAWALKLLGDIAACDQEAEPDRPVQYYEKALSLARELGMRPLEAHCHLGLGNLYAKTVNHDRAIKELSAAIDLYTVMEMVFWLDRVKTSFQELSV